VCNVGAFVCMIARGELSCGACFLFPVGRIVYSCCSFERHDAYGPSMFDSSLRYLDRASRIVCFGSPRRLCIGDTVCFVVLGGSGFGELCLVAVVQGHGLPEHDEPACRRVGF